MESVPLLGGGLQNESEATPLSAQVNPGLGVVHGRFVMKKQGAS